MVEMHVQHVQLPNTLSAIYMSDCSKLCQSSALFIGVRPTAGCLHNVASSLPRSADLPCPVCSKPTPLSDSGVEDLAKNFGLLEFIPGSLPTNQHAPDGRLMNPSQGRRREDTQLCPGVSS